MACIFLIYVFCSSILLQKKGIQEPDVDWEVAADYHGENVDGAVLVPKFECPLNEGELAELNTLIHQSDLNTPLTDLYVLCCEYVTGRCNLWSKYKATPSVEPLALV